MFASTSWRINYAKLISSTIKQMKIHLPNPTVIALLMVHLVGCMIPQTGHNKPPKMFPLKLRIFQGLSPEIVAAMDHIPRPSPVFFAVILPMATMDFPQDAALAGLLLLLHLTQDDSGWSCYKLYKQKPSKLTSELCQISPSWSSRIT